MAKEHLNYMLREYCDYELPAIEELRDVLSRLSNQQKIDILQTKYSHDVFTPLYCAGWWGHTEILSTLLTSVESADRMKLLLPQLPPLLTAAWYGHTESVKVILDCLTADHQLQVMSAQWYGGTLIQWAEMWGKTDTAALLREYQYKAECVQRGEYGELICFKP